MQAKTSMKFSAFTSAALLLALGVSCQQARMYCTTAHGTFGAKYTLTSNNANDPCAQHKGDILGFQTYFATGGVNGTPKFDVPSVAIRSLYGGLALDAALHYPVEVPGFDYDDHAANALGDFKSGDPSDAEDFCFVEKFSGGDVNLPELPLIPGVPGVMDDPNTPEDETVEEVPEVPATPPRRVIHQWKDAKWLVNADAQGTQFEADLTFTEDGCVAEYHVTAVYPALDCQTDEDCSKDDSGLNPGFAVACDLDINVNGLDSEDDPSTPEDETANFGICVLKDALPSYE